MTTITVSGADGSASAEYDLPFSGIEYLNFFSSPDVMLRNLARPGELSEVVGAPTISGGKLNAKSRTNYVRTQVTQPATAGTLIAAARCVDDASSNAVAPRLIGGYSAGSLANGSVGLMPRSATSMSGLLTLNNAGAYFAQWTDRTDTITAWNIWSFRWAAGVARVDNLTLGISQQTTFANPIAVSSNRLCVGSDALTGGATFLGESSIASACIVSRSISDGELAEMVRRMRYVAALSDIIV